MNNVEDFLEEPHKLLVPNTNFKLLSFEMANEPTQIGEEN